MLSFLRSGGLKQKPHSIDEVTSSDVHSFLTNEVSIVQDVRTLRPSITTIVGRLEKPAKKVFGFKDDLLETPRSLGLRGRTRQFAHEPNPFLNVPLAMTMEQVENLVGDGWKVGTSRGQDSELRRIKAKMPAISDE